MILGATVFVGLTEQEATVVVVVDELVVVVEELVDVVDELVVVVDELVVEDVVVDVTGETEQLKCFSYSEPLPAAYRNSVTSYSTQPGPVTAAGPGTATVPEEAAGTTFTGALLAEATLRDPEYFLNSVCTEPVRNPVQDTVGDTEHASIVIDFDEVPAPATATSSNEPTTAVTAVTTTSRRRTGNLREKRDGQTGR